MIPRFSSRSDASLSELVDRILALDIPDALAQLREIFPAQPKQDNDLQYGEEATYEEAGVSGYAREESEIFKPIETAYAHVMTISGLIALRIGAFG